ncbi:MAG: enolase C-terminal domain-like protein, partial [Gemmataceae bacterium]
GSMPLGNVWSYPSPRMSYDETLLAMKELAGALAHLYRSCIQVGHPIDLTWNLEHAIFESAKAISREKSLPDPMPPLASLVVASPFDAALHDAFGKVHGRNCYLTYAPPFLTSDLGAYLGPEFAGRYLHEFLRSSPVPSMPLYHLVGALDPIEPGDVTTPVKDGLPETLGEWIHWNGLTHLKIKLSGDDPGWDADRIRRIETCCVREQQRRGVTSWHYSLDFNEKCPGADALLHFLQELEKTDPAALSRVAYIEQPTERNLRGSRHRGIKEAARKIPVVIDESLLDLESLQQAREIGYTGAALKACKGQTQSLLMAAAAQTYDMFLCVQDLTCPGASLIHSAGLAAHVPGVTAIEANSRQFVPAANRGWETRFPGIFQTTNGMLDTRCLTGPGLGAFPVDSD